MAADVVRAKKGGVATLQRMNMPRVCMHERVRVHMSVISEIKHSFQILRYLINHLLLI